MYVYKGEGEHNVVGKFIIDGQMKSIGFKISHTLELTCTWYYAISTYIRPLPFLFPLSSPHVSFPLVCVCVFYLINFFFFLNVCPFCFKIILFNLLVLFFSNVLILIKNIGRIVNIIL